MLVKRILFFILPVMLFFSCGAGSGKFRLEGRFRNMNSGEFYVYSPDGGIEGMDTVKLQDGRFSYEIPCHRPTILVLVFQNFSEQAVFAESGASVTLKADASHMKEMEVKGTDDNKLMTNFRKETAHMSPPEICKFAATTVSDHPESAVAPWLIWKYFINTLSPDYRKASQLLSTVAAHQSENGFVAILRQRVGAIAKASKGQSLPKFSLKTTGGSMVGNASLSSGVAVISVLASWYFDSEDMQRILRSYQKSSGGRLHLLTLSADASPKEFQPLLQRDTITWQIVCDGKMMDSPALSIFGLSDITDNIVVNNGRIVARSLTKDQMRQTLDRLLK